MNECTKALARGLRDPGYRDHFFVGRGIDVGAGPDGLGAQRQHFPRMGKVRHWDVFDGDGEVLEGVGPCEFDFVHSSHSLEHMRDPYAALRRWVEVVAYGSGHVIVLVPDEDLYEQGVWPSTFNGDHKHTFTSWKRASWSPASVNIIDLARSVPEAELVRLEVLDMAPLATDRVTARTRR